MPNLNEVNLMGNLTRDIELKYTPAGLAVAQLGLAINRKWRDQKTNEAREEVTYVDITFFGKQAETLNTYVNKGDPLFVKGRLKLDSWVDKATNQNRYKLKVIGEHFQFLRSAKSQGNGQPQQQGQRATKPTQAQPQQEQQVDPVDYDLDIPPDSVPF